MTIRTTTSLTDSEALETYHTPNQVLLELYPAIPLDIDDWADQVLVNEEAKANFLKLMGEEYSICLIVDRVTGDIKIGDVTFNSHD